MAAPDIPQAPIELRAFRPALIVLDTTALKAAHAAQAAATLGKFQEAISALTVAPGLNGAPPPAVAPVTVIKRGELVVDAATAAVPILQSALSGPPPAAAAPAKGKKDAAPPAPTASADDIIAGANAVTPESMVSAVAKRVAADYTKYCLATAKAEFERQQAAAAAASGAPPAKPDPKAKAAPAKGAPAPAVDPSLQAAVDLLGTRLDLTAAGAPTHIYIMLDGLRTPVEMSAFFGNGSITASVSESASTAILPGFDPAAPPPASGTPTDVATYFQALQWQVPGTATVPFLCAISLSVPPAPPAPPADAAPAAAPAGRDAKGAKGGKPDPKAAGKGDPAPGEAGPPTPLDQLVSCVDTRFGWGYSGPTGAALVQALPGVFPSGAGSASVAELTAELNKLPKPTVTAAAPAAAAAPVPGLASITPIGPHPFGSIAIKFADVRDVQALDILIPFADDPAAPAPAVPAADGAQGSAATAAAPAVEVTYTSPPVPPPPPPPPAKGQPPPPPVEVPTEPFPKTVRVLSPEGLAAVIVQGINSTLVQRESFRTWLNGTPILNLPEAVQGGMDDLVAMHNSSGSSAGSATATQVAAAAAVEYRSILDACPAASIGISTLLFAAVEAVASVTAQVGVPFEMPHDTPVWTPTMALLPVSGISSPSLDSHEDGASAGSGTGMCAVQDPSCSGCSSSGRIGGVPAIHGLIEGPLADRLLADLKGSNGDLLTLEDGPGGRPRNGSIGEDQDPTAPTDGPELPGAPPTAAAIRGEALMKPKLRWVAGGQAVPLGTLVDIYRSNLAEAREWFDRTVRGATSLPAADTGLFRLARAAASIGLEPSSLSLSLDVTSPLLESSQPALHHDGDRGTFPIAIADRLVMMSVRPKINLASTLLNPRRDGTGVVITVPAVSGGPSQLSAGGSVGAGPSVGSVASQQASVELPGSSGDKSGDKKAFDKLSGAGVSDAAADLSEFSALSSLPKDIVARTLCLRAIEALLQAVDTAAASAYIASVERRAMVASEALELHPWRLGSWAWSEMGDATDMTLALTMAHSLHGAGAPSSLTVAGADPTSGSLLLALHTPVPRRRVSVTVLDPVTLMDLSRVRPSLAQWAAAGASTTGGAEALLDLGCRVALPAASSSSAGSAAPAPSASSSVVYSIYPADNSLLTVRQPLVKLGEGDDAAATAQALVRSTISGAKDGHNFGLSLRGASEFVFIAQFSGDGHLGCADVAGPSSVTVQAISRKEPKKRRASKGPAGQGKSDVQPSERVGLMLSYTTSETLRVRVHTEGWTSQQYLTAAADVQKQAFPGTPSNDGTGKFVNTGERMSNGEPWAASQFSSWPAWLPEISRKNIGAAGTVYRHLKGGVGQLLYADGAISWWLPPAAAAYALGPGLAEALSGHAAAIRAGYETKVEAAKGAFEQRLIDHRREQEEKQAKWKAECDAIQAAAAAEPPKKGKAPPPPQLPPQPEVELDPQFEPPPPSIEPSPESISSCLKGVWIDTAADGSRRARVLLNPETVSAVRGDEADGELPAGAVGALPADAQVLYLPLPPATVYTSNDPGTAGVVRVRYDHCPVPDPEYVPPPPMPPAPKPVYRLGREVQKVKNAQERIHHAHIVNRREALGGLWSGVEFDDRRTPVWDGRGSGPQRGRVAMVTYPGRHGRTLVIHPDGTHIATEPSASRVVVACRGFATVESDSSYGAVADQHVRGAKVNTSASGPRTRFVVTMPDGVMMASDYDCSITSSINARLRLHRADGIAVVATDDARVQYRPAGVSAQGHLSVAGPTGGMGATASIDPVTGRSRSTSPNGRSRSPTGRRASSTGRRASATSRPASPTRGGYSSDGSTGSATGRPSGKSWPPASLSLGTDPHADLMDGHSAVSGARGLAPLPLQGSFTFHLKPVGGTRRATVKGSKANAVSTGPMAVETVDQLGNYFGVSVRLNPTTDGSATHALPLDVAVQLAGCVLPDGRTLVPRPPVPMVLSGDASRGAPLLTASVPGAPTGSAVVVPRIEQPLPPTIFVLTSDGRGSRLIGPEEWSLTAQLTSGGFGHGRLALGGWAESAANVLLRHAAESLAQGQGYDGQGGMSAPASPGRGGTMKLLGPPNPDSPVQVLEVSPGRGGDGGQVGFDPHGTLDLMSLRGAQPRSASSAPKNGPAPRLAAPASVNSQPSLQLTDSEGHPMPKPRILAVGARQGAAPLGATAPPAVTQVFVLSPTRGDPVTLTRAFVLGADGVAGAEPSALAPQRAHVQAANAYGCGIINLRGRDTIRTSQAVWVVPKPARRRQHSVHQIFGDKALDSPLARRERAAANAQAQDFENTKRQLATAIAGDPQADGTSPPRDFSAIRDPTSNTVVPQALAVHGLAGGAGPDASAVVGDDAAMGATTAGIDPLADTLASVGGFGMTGGCAGRAGQRNLQLPEPSSPLARTLSATGGPGALFEAASNVAQASGLDVSQVNALAAAMKSRYAARVFVAVPELLTPPYEIFARHESFVKAPPLVLWRTLAQHVQLTMDDRALLLAQERLWSSWRAVEAVRAARYSTEDPRHPDAIAAEGKAAEAVHAVRKETGTLPARHKSLMQSLQRMAKATSGMTFIKASANAEAEKRDAAANAQEALEAAAAARLANLEIERVRRSRGGYTPRNRSGSPSHSPRRLAATATVGFVQQLPTGMEMTTGDGAAAVMLRMPSREEYGLVLDAAQQRQEAIRRRAAEEEKADSLGVDISGSLGSQPSLDRPGSQEDLGAHAARVAPLDQLAMTAAQRRAAQAAAPIDRAGRMAPYEVGAVLDYSTGVLTVAAAGEQGVRSPRGRVRTPSQSDGYGSDGGGGMAALEFDEAEDDSRLDAYSIAKKAAEADIASRVASRINPHTGKTFSFEEQRRMRIMEMKGWEKKMASMGKGPKASSVAEAQARAKAIAAAAKPAVRGPPPAAKPATSGSDRAVEYALQPGQYTGVSSALQSAETSISMIGSDGQPNVGGAAGAAGAARGGQYIPSSAASGVSALNSMDQTFMTMQDGSSMPRLPQDGSVRQDVYGQDQGYGGNGRGRGASDVQDAKEAELLLAQIKREDERSGNNRVGAMRGQQGFTAAAQPGPDITQSSGQIGLMSLQQYGSSLDRLAQAAEVVDVEGYPFDGDGSGSQPRGQAPVTGAGRVSGTPSVEGVPPSDDPALTRPTELRRSSFKAPGHVQEFPQFKAPGQGSNGTTRPAPVAPGQEGRALEESIGIVGYAGGVPNVDGPGQMGAVMLEEGKTSDYERAGGEPGAFAGRPARPMSARGASAAAGAGTGAGNGGAGMLGDVGRYAAAGSGIAAVRRASGAGLGTTTLPPVYDPESAGGGIANAYTVGKVKNMGVGVGREGQGLGGTGANGDYYPQPLSTGVVAAGYGMPVGGLVGSIPPTALDGVGAVSKATLTSYVTGGPQPHLPFPTANGPQQTPINVQNGSNSAAVPAPIATAPGSTVGLSPSSARFGNVPAGGVYRVELTLHNLGGGPLKFRVDRAHAALPGVTPTGTSGCNGVRLLADTAPVQRNSTRTLVLELAAPQSGLFSDTVQLITPAETLTIPVSARVLGPNEKA